MKMRKNKFVPINSLKKTKVQFSTRLSGCLGEHQSQEFFERVNITRQSGICSKNKNNSFGDKRSNSFRQTLQLNVPFVADFSESKQFCICYPVHFFRKKLHSYDSEDNRLASIRVYFPASRMKNGNEFKVSLDLKKRVHLHPYQFEFVAYNSLLTLSLEDLSLAVFRAKSSSEKFKIVSSLTIPRLLISQSVSNSQTGAPIFIATERIYSRIVKLIACGQSDAFKLKTDSALNLDSSIVARKCLLKWIGLEDFLPPSSRIIFVRRVSSDSGETLGQSILNSPGPKIKRSRLKEHERSLIRLKQIKLEPAEGCDDPYKEVISPDETQSPTIKIINPDSQDSKRPRGRPKKQLDKSNSVIDINFTDDLLFPKKDDSEQLVAEKIKRESSQLKSESTSNSMTDSTSEEKYSVHLSSCTTPDTNKSCSPVLLNGTVTMSLSSTTSTLQASSDITDSNIVKNKRGRPRKYPMTINVERTVFKTHKEFMDCQSTIQDSDNGSFRNRKRSSADSINESNNKRFKSSNSSSSSNEGNLFKQSSNGLDFEFLANTPNDKLDINVQSIWIPLKYPLAAPDPVVPFTKELSNTGLSTVRKSKFPTSSLTPSPLEVLNKSIGCQGVVPDFGSLKSNFDSKFPDNLGKALLNANLRAPSPSKTMFGKDNITGHSINDNQYLSPNNNNNNNSNSNSFNPSMMTSTNYNNNLLMPLINNIFPSFTPPFVSNQTPIINSLGSLFNSLNPVTNTNKIPPSSLYDVSCRQNYPSGPFLTNNDLSTHNLQPMLQHHLHYNQILASKYDYLYPWNNDYQWKY